MIKKYIKGNDSRGNEIISELEKLGGINKNLYTGFGNSIFYYIDENNIIEYSKVRMLDQLIEEFFEEIYLPINFKEQFFTFKTAKEINKCEGCIFINPYNCIPISDLLSLPDCEENSIIYIKH